MTRKHIASMNAVPGDETTKVLPVYVLTEEQQAARTAIATARQKYNDAKDAARQAGKEIDRLMEACTHHVFTDVAGFPYDSRTCYLCGGGMGSV